MPWADYECKRAAGGCGTVIRDHVYAMRVGAIASAPDCPYCSSLTDYPGERPVTMSWIPACRFDTRTDGEGSKGGFQKFTVHRQVPTREGMVQVEETIDSLHTLRKIERDSEQRFRDGEGEAMRFRMWNQESSNKQDNSFGAAGKIGDQTYDSGSTPQKKPNVGVTRHGQTKPKVALGPGLRRPASPLKG